MKTFFKKIFPDNFKRFLHLLKRKINDFFEGVKFSNHYHNEPVGIFRIRLSQEIKKGAFYENKLHNLKIVRDKINNLIIDTDETFSFWKLVGKPNRINGFREGRNLKKGKISSDFGGGICQFSSILYFAFLKSGLEILERFPHSKDIYKENERFMPLGSDCTVVFGYKDLRIKNNFNFPIQLKCTVENEKLWVEIMSPQEIEEKKINFLYTETQNGVWVETEINGKSEFKNFYCRE